MMYAIAKTYTYIYSSFQPRGVEAVGSPGQTAELLSSGECTVLVVAVSVG